MLSCCRRASTAVVLQYRQAQHSTAQLARTKPQSNYMPIRVLQRKYMPIRVGESQHMSSSIYTYSTLSSRNERSDRNLPGLENCTTIVLSAGVMREGFASSFDLTSSFDLNKIPHSSFSLSFFFPMYFVRARGVRVILEHGALGICKSSVCT